MAGDVETSELDEKATHHDIRHKSGLGGLRCSPCGTWTLMHDVQDETSW